MKTISQALYWIVTIIELSTKEDQRLFGFITCSTTIGFINCLFIFYKIIPGILTINSPDYLILVHCFYQENNLR